MYKTIIHIKILEINELMHIAALPKTNKSIIFHKHLVFVFLDNEDEIITVNLISNSKDIKKKKKPHHILSTVVGLYVYAN